MSAPPPDREPPSRRASGEPHRRDPRAGTPALGTLLVRGFTRRCPVCGSGGLFRRWFRMAERCPRCDLRFEREPGTFVGAVGMNTIVSFVLLFVVLVVSMALTYPRTPR
ncbi:MAG: DUF983 domain-containing protein [Acidimicrobiia bacterium]|nr:DUF983 domain-containing protein [Acidimicrobiia bacterium]